jgi:ubiquinone/menaquinone biosynthesis C-methylase UbiE
MAARKASGSPNSPGVYWVDRGSDMSIENQPKAGLYRLGYNPLVMGITARVIYPLLTSLVRTDEEVVFLNDGYEEDPPMAVPLSESDEPNRYPIQLYHRTVTQADISGKRVLEVSCGHGGGASYLVRTLHPASYVGLDLNSAGIAYCKKYHDLPGLDFLQGNAENLPFPDDSFDAVINVEASHCYPRFPRFLAEVVRVLRPGGHFLYTDVRGRVRVAEWEAALADAPLRMLSHEDINEQVVRGLEKSWVRSKELINRHLPAFLNRFGREAASGPGSGIYRALQSGEMAYRMYSFVKD